MKKTAIFLSVIVVCLVLIGIGFYIGNQKGSEQGATAIEEKYKPLLERSYPKPPEVLNSIKGVVKKIAGGTIQMEVNDPEDYLPHADNSPRKTLTRFATVLPSTALVTIDYTSGTDVKTSPLTLSALKGGMTIFVSTEANIRTSATFDATKIELVK